MIYPLSILFTLIFVLYSKWQFSEVRGESEGKWHPYGMIMRWMLFLTPFVMQYFPNNWKDYLLAGAINIILWEFGINKLALNKHLLYKGKIDEKLGKKKWWIYFGFLLLTLIIKYV